MLEMVRYILSFIITMKHVIRGHLNSLEFTINRLFMKLFKTNNLDIVNYCQHCFGFEMPSELWAKRITKLNERIANCTNSFVARFSQV